jgi:hypothetical protein
MAGQLPDETRITGRLPNLEIEIRHRRTEDGEQISISMIAMPSFEAFARVIEAGNPLLAWMGFNPFLAWMKAAEQFWLPMLRGLPAPSSEADARRR